MATYLKFHELNDSPFERPAGDRFVLATDALRRAYAEIRSGLDDDSPRICLSGGAGIGKSSLASALPKLLGDGFRTVLVRDPSVPWERMKAALIRQLGLTDSVLSRSTLEQAHASNKRIVLILDQAEKVEAESLEHLDVILGYKTETGEQLVRCVLLANLEEASSGRDVPLLWWLDQLTTLQLSFSPIPDEGIRAYVDKHLKKAGWKGGSLFTDEAIRAIHRYTGGIPGTVSALCEELLARAADQRMTQIDAGLVRAQCEPEAVVADRTDTESAAPGFDPDPTPWPQLGSDISDPEPQPIEPPRRAPMPQPPEPRVDVELEMKVEQGYVPMDTPAIPEQPEFEQFHVRPIEPSWGAGTAGIRVGSSRSPGRRGVSGTFKLLVLMSIAVTATAYVYWPADAPIPRPRLRAMIPPPLIAEPEPERIDGAETGLTADLRVPDTSVAKPKPSAATKPGLAAEPPTARQSSTGPPSQVRVDTVRVGPAQSGPPTFEPWAEQQPEGDAADTTPPASPTP
jgi:type II secretory pathway predicted ATPase ExeA